MSSQTCQTCLSDLRTAPGFVPSCCGVPICQACVAANPRLSTWVPCLRCGSSTTSSPRKTPPVPAGVKTTQVEGQRKTKKERKREAEEDQFVLVGSDDEDEDARSEGVEGEEGGEGEANSGSRGDKEGGKETGAAKSGGEEDRPPSPELVEIKHVPQRGETLLTIARKYATDVSSVTYNLSTSLSYTLELNFPRSCGLRIPRAQR